MTGPLNGIKVLDLSRVLAGPYCTQMFGDMGAEVIKIEKPQAGDDTRHWGPPFQKDANGQDTQESAYYLSVNRNKKSVAIDIATTDGQALILKLLESTDILIENFKVGAMKRFGLSHEQLKEKFPRLIYCSITGYGQTGPLASEPGYDLVAQAIGGLMGTTGEPNGSPMKTSVAVSDILTGLHASVGILSALHARHETGKGQHIDVALLDCTLATMTNLAQYYLTSGRVAPRQGNAHSTIAPYQAFQASDGWLVIAVGNDTQFTRLCDFLGNTALAQDSRFQTNPARATHKQILTEEISSIVKNKTVRDIVDACRAINIPAGPVNTIDQTFNEPQIQARAMQIDFNGQALVGSPLKFSDTPSAYKKSPPRLGEDTQATLSALGLTSDELKALHLNHVIQREE